MSKSKKVSTAVAEKQPRRISLTREGAIVMAAAAAVCLLPMILGTRLYGQMPAVVPTNIIGQNGQDDSIPRAMAVYGIPALMCVLSLLAHYQINTDPKRVYGPAAIREICAWGFPVLSVLPAAVFMLQAAGQTVDVHFYTPAVMGLCLLAIGGGLFQRGADSFFAIRLGSIKGDETLMRHTNRMTGCTWMALGVLLVGFTMVGITQFGVTGGAVLLALLAPFVYSRRSH